MQTFAKRPKATQQTESGKSTVLRPLYSRQSRAVCSILHLQRATGNQVLQRMPQSNTEELEARSAATASTRFAHGFSQIPLHAKARTMIQPKLTIDTAGDIFEQEADRVADQVIHLPEPKPQCAAVCSGECPDHQTMQVDPAEDSLWRRSNQASGLANISPVVRGVIRSTGQVLDPQDRAFFEPRFGYDFSGVQVHSDEKASESARVLNARAYTVGQNVVFGAGQYAPSTNAGKRLLAHELTHVVQQTRGKVHPPNLQRLSFGSDGRLPRRHQAIVREAAGVAERKLRERGPHSFRRKWDAFWQTEGKSFSPKPTFEQYRRAVKNRIVHDMDTSNDSSVRQHREDDGELPLELQTAAVTRINSRNTYIRQFAIEQGIDTVVSLILHESFHGAGLPEGPPGFPIYEPSLHQFETSVGFPMMMGGGDILNVQQQRQGDYHVDVSIEYRLREIEEDSEIPEHLEIQVTHNDGTLVSQEEAGGNRAEVKHRIPSQVGRATWVWNARYPSAFTYSIRIVNVSDGTLLAAKRIEVSPRCIIGVSSVHCE